MRFLLLPAIAVLLVGAPAQAQSTGKWLHCQQATGEVVPADFKVEILRGTTDLYLRIINAQELGLKAVVVLPNPMIGRMALPPGGEPRPMPLIIDWNDYSNTTGVSDFVIKSTALDPALHTTALRFDGWMTVSSKTIKIACEETTAPPSSRKRKAS